MHIRLDKDRLSKIKLYIALPAYGGLTCVENTLSVSHLHDALTAFGVEHVIRYKPDDSLITRARNNMTDDFMHWGGVLETPSPDDRMLWIDSDITFDVEDILVLLSLDLDIVAAPYATKGLNWDRIREAALEGYPSHLLPRVGGQPNCNWIVTPVTLDQPTPVRESGNGLLMVKRSVYATFRDRYPELRYTRTNDEYQRYGNRRHNHLWFDAHICPDTNQYLSEDWAFCRRAQKIGYEIYSCLWMKTGHIGRFQYPCDVPAVAQLLDQTKGWINGPARGSDEPPSNGTGAARTPQIPEADEAAVPSHPGPLGS